MLTKNCYWSWKLKSIENLKKNKTFNPQNWFKFCICRDFPTTTEKIALFLCYTRFCLWIDCGPSLKPGIRRERLNWNNANLSDIFFSITNDRGSLRCVFSQVNNNWNGRQTEKLVHIKVWLVFSPIYRDQWCFPYPIVNHSWLRCQWDDTSSSGLFWSK